MKKNFGNDIATAMNKSLFKNASADELQADDEHMHDSACADDCVDGSSDSLSADDTDSEETPMDKKEAAFQLAVDSLLSASAYLEAMAEDRKSDFILKVAANLVKEKDTKAKEKKLADKQKASDKKDKERAMKDKQKAKDQLAKEKEKAAKEKLKEKEAKEKDKLKASDKKDKEDKAKKDDKKSDKKDDKSDKKKSFKDFIKSKKKD